MSRSPLQRLLLVLVLLVPALSLFQPQFAFAQEAGDGRPYLELPFPAETSYEVTCGYNCYQHRNSMYYGVDFAIPEGDPIVAAAAGEVMAITWEIGLPANLNLGDALIVYIDHGGGWFTRYVHLSGLTVKVGDTVAMGDVIGYSGKTGASGDHLHFELKYGNSLHSPSVPINELFGGEEPVAGAFYESRNLPLLASTPSMEVVAAAAQGEATEVPEAAAPLEDAAATVELSTTLDPAPLIAPQFEALLPRVEVSLELSASEVTAGEPVTATFTLRNETGARLHLSRLGIGGRLRDGESPTADSLFYDRSIILNPNRSYEFERTHVFQQAGDLELFIFALSAENEWVPISGSGQVTSLSVDGPPPAVFLPLINQQVAPAPEP